MELFNRQEHQRCLAFDHSERPMIEVLKTMKEHEEKREFSRNEIVFMMEGKMEFTFRNHPQKSVQKGQFIFIPVGGTLHFKAGSKSMALVIRLSDRVRFCQGVMVEQLFEKCKVPQGETINPAAIHPLDIKAPLWHFMTGVAAVFSDGLMCRQYFETKVQEFFILLWTYYTKEKLRDFFALILSPDTAFSEYVRANVLQYKTVGEFAAGLNMTAKQFTRKFGQVFGHAPHTWMLQEKTRRIQADLMLGEKDNKQIAYEYDFSTVNHLYDFCKKNLGATPGEIRGKNRNGENWE